MKRDKQSTRPVEKQQEIAAAPEVTNVAIDSSSAFDCAQRLPETKKSRRRRRERQDLAQEKALGAQQLPPKVASVGRIVKYPDDGSFWSDSDSESDSLEGLSSSSNEEYPPLDRESHCAEEENEGLDKTMGYEVDTNVYLRYCVTRLLLVHQREGVKWLYKRYSEKKGGILGDDMGLGKVRKVSRREFTQCLQTDELFSSLFPT